MQYSKDQFEANLVCLEERQPALAAKLRSIETITTKVIEDGPDGQNLDLGHVSFYDCDAETFAQAQVERFLEKPDRVNVVGAGFGAAVTKKEIDQNRTTAEKMLLLSRNWMIEQQVTADVKLRDPDAGFMFILGVGLGYHFDKLISDIEARYVVVVEQFVEFLYHALHIHDLASWYQKVESRGGALSFFFGDNPSLLTTTLFNYVKFKAFELTDGSYVYVHYNSFFLKEVEREFNEKVSLLTANPGFFEDELVMMTNCFRNITAYEHLPYMSRPRMEKEVPVFIVGSGPSLDDSIDLIREYRDRIVVFSCGTGLGALLGHGITPDFHAELENTPGPLEILTALTERYDLSPITLVAANTVNPEVPKLFERRIMFFRDSVTSTYIFGAKYGAVYNAAPTVTNTASRLAVGLGFRNLYLVGVDLGSRYKGRHHSQQSVYCADETFMDTHPEHKSASDFKYRARGNFGGTVLTNQSFLWSSTMFQALNDMVSDLVMVNCSDGIRIAGTRPQLPETVQLEISASKRNRELALVIDEHDNAKEIIKIDIAAMEEIFCRMEVFYGRVEAALDGFEPTKAGFYELHDRLHPITYKSEDDGVEGDVVRQFHVGTVMMLMQIAHVVLRRLPEEVRRDYLIFFKAEFQKFLEQMRERGLACISGILDEAKRQAQ